MTYLLDAGGCVEDVGGAAGAVERNEEQRFAAVDAVVADANQVAAHHRHRTLDGVVVNEERFHVDGPVEWNVRPVGHLPSVFFNFSIRCCLYKQYIVLQITINRPTDRPNDRPTDRPTDLALLKVTRDVRRVDEIVAVDDDPRAVHVPDVGESVVRKAVGQRRLALDRRTVDGRVTGVASALTCGYAQRSLHTLAPKSILNCQI